MRRTGLAIAVSLMISAQSLAAPPATPRGAVATQLASVARRIALRADEHLLHVIEPRNTSGFEVRPPPSLAVAHWNVKAAIKDRLHRLRPRRPYTSWVEEGKLLRGSQLTRAELVGLRAQGVKTVVNLRRESNAEAPWVAELGMRPVWLPVHDQGLPTHAEVAAFLRVALEPANQPVYVHCLAGKGRTGVFAAVYRIAHDGYTADEAVAEALRLGMGSDDQEGFIRAFARDYRAGVYGP